MVQGEPREGFFSLLSLHTPGRGVLCLLHCLSLLGMGAEPFLLPGKNIFIYKTMGFTILFSFHSY